MNILWDSGTALSGSGAVTIHGDLFRVELTTIPAYLTSSGSSPALYRNLGIVGAVVNTARQLGEVLQWPTQLVGPFPTIADSLWYRLVAGVSGTLYQGFEMTDQIGVGAYVHNNASISIPNTTATALTFNTETLDPWGMHDLAANTGRLTCVAPGWYAIGASIVWAANATGFRQIRFVMNATSVIGTIHADGIAGGADLTRMAGTIFRWLSIGDFVEVQLYQNSGGALNALVEAADSPDFWMVRAA